MLPLDPHKNRTYHYWHAFVPGLKAGQIYAYRADGPFAPERGQRFNREKVLIDPYGLAVAVPDRYDRAAGKGFGDDAATAMKSVVANPDEYDWEGDAPLRRPVTIADLAVDRARPSRRRYRPSAVPDPKPS